MVNGGISNPFVSSSKFTDRKVHIGISGSVACYKMADLLRAWLKLGMHATVTLTDGACHFVTPLLFRSLGAAKVYSRLFEEQDDVFAHLEPGQNMEAMLVAPASADALARIANGRAEDMLSAQALAFPGPLLFAPAMNPKMWANPATKQHAKALTERGAVFIGPVGGSTACGETGEGHLAPDGQIFLELLRALAPQDMTGQKVMLTMGPTREKWDGVRFLSNPSSGTMGAALATCAWLRGAEITAICGPISGIFLPEGIKRIDVESAREMHDAAKTIWPDMTLGMFCAAVADFAPVRPAQGDGIKLHKTDMGDQATMDLVRNPDILLEMAANRSNSQKVLGFAAEITTDMKSLLKLAAAKQARKNADLLAANRVNPGEGAFGSSEDSMAVVDINGEGEIWQTQSKADVAWELCTWLLRL